MKQGRALPEVLTELQRQNAAKQDYIGPAQAFHLEPDGRTFSISHMASGAQETFGTTDLFHRQVGSALGIPAKYYDMTIQDSFIFFGVFLRKAESETLNDSVCRIIRFSSFFKIFHCRIIIEYLIVIKLFRQKI